MPLGWAKLRCDPSGRVMTGMAGLFVLFGDFSNKQKVRQSRTPSGADYTRHAISGQSGNWRETVLPHAQAIFDELTAQEEIVVKPYDAAREGLPFFGGATLLDDGRPSLIVDVSSLL